MPRLIGTSGDDTISVINDAGTLNGDAAVPPVNAVSGSDGNDSILIQDSSIAGTVRGGQGNDDIRIGDGSRVGIVNSGGGADTVVATGATLDALETGGGQDDVVVIETDVLGDIDLGRGADDLRMSGATVGGNLITGVSDDAVTLVGGVISGDIFLDDGDDQITLFQAPEISGTLNGGDGTDQIEVPLGAIITDDADPANPIVVTSAGQVVPNLSSGTITLKGDGSTISYNSFEQAVGITCFVKGTQILTPRGEKPIETLRVGDRVVTKDNGVKRIGWIGSAKRPAMGAFAPIRIREGAMGNKRDLFVSPQHRMLIQNAAGEVLFGEAEVLATAQSLINDHSIMRHVGRCVMYYHLLFDQHEIIFAEGAETESFHPGAYGFDTLGTTTQAELIELFPAFALGDFSAIGPTARQSLRHYEGQLAGHMI